MLNSIPTEIHHEIFNYLDYVGDVCCHPYLYAPTIVSVPSSLEEFEELLTCEECLDFDPPSKDPLCMVSRSFFNSVKSFKPTILNLTIFTERRKCSFPLDAEYTYLLSNFQWFRMTFEQTNNITINEWCDTLVDFVKKMKNQFKTNPFSHVEFISFSKRIGKNHGYKYSYFNSIFPKVFELFPNSKYYLMNFNPHIEPLTINFNGTRALVHATLAEIYSSHLTKVGNVYWSAMDWEQKPISHIQELKNLFPHQYKTNIEVFLFNSISSQNLQEASYIIDNFRLDINRFSHICNIQYSDSKERFKGPGLLEVMNLLQKVYNKYPSFKLFRIPIYDLECLQIIMSYPFVQISVGRNITKKFLEAIIKDDQVASFCKDYNVDLSSLGVHKFSAVCLLQGLEASKTHIEDTCDIFGVTPKFLKMNNLDTMTRDAFGNNFLHYYFYTYGTSRVMNFIKQIPENELRRLSQDPNIFGVIPCEIMAAKGIKEDLENFKKEFTYEGITKTLGNNFTKLMFLDGLIVDARILLATRNAIHPSYSYDDYKDINYRDENGKHLVHYFNSCFNPTVQNLGIPFRDLIFCRDNTQTIPIQTCVDDYYVVLNQLGTIENLPKLNFISHTNDFGMLRIMFLLVNFYLDTERIICESNSLGFDYSLGKPEMISLLSHYSNGHYSFSIERSQLKQLKNISYFGTVDGDDISHYVVRFYLNHVTNYYLDSSILKVLIGKGLKLDIVRNSKGQTALDLLNSFRGTPQMMTGVKKLKKACKRGLSTKSKALAKFAIRHSTPSELIVEQSESNLIIKSDKPSLYRVRIERSLYFEPKKNPFKV